MNQKLKALEGIALTAQQNAGRAWADLCAASAADRAEMQANYDAALATQNATYADWAVAAEH